MQKVRDKVAKFLRYLAKRAGNYESLEMIGELYVVKNNKPILLGRKMITDNGLRFMSLALFAYDTMDIGDTALDDGITPSSYWGSQWAFGRFHNVGTGTQPESPTDDTLQSPIFSNLKQADQLKRILDLANGRLTLMSIANFSFDNSYNITEHGIWCAHTVGVYTLFDRTLINPLIHVSSGDILPFIYKLVIQR